MICILYKSEDADEGASVEFWGCRVLIKKKQK